MQNTSHSILPYQELLAAQPEFFLLDQATGTRVQHNVNPISAETWLAQQNQKPKEQSR